MKKTVKNVQTRVGAVILAAALGMSAMGCTSNGEKTVSGETELSTGTPSGTEETAPSGSGEDTAGTAMGRYVEETVYEAEIFDRVQAKVLDNGQMMFVNGVTGQKFVSDDNGATWEKEEDAVFAEFAENHYAVATSVSGGGVLAVISMDRKAGQEDSENPEYEYNLYVCRPDGDGNVFQRIDITLPDQESYLCNLTFGEQNRLFVYARGCNTVFEVNIGDGTAAKLVDIPDRGEVMDCRNNLLMCGAYEKMYLYDLEKNSFIEDGVLDDFVTGDLGGVSWYGSGFSALPFLGEDNAVYVADEKGVYRHVVGGTAIEQVIAGNLSSFGDPSHSVMAIMKNSEEEFLAMFSDGKVNRFTYDATVATVPDNMLTVYSLKEDDLIRQTIAVYQTANTDMYINYEIGMDGNGITREDALKKLNTELLSGNGPDVIMLDGMNIDTYVEKGVLLDLSDIVEGTDSDVDLFMNLMQPFYHEEKIYAVPGSFTFPIIAGKDEDLQAVSDYQSLAELVEKIGNEQPGMDIVSCFSATALLKFNFPICEPAWKDADGQPDEGRIREYLELTRRIYDVQMANAPKEYIEMYEQAVLENGVDYYEGSDYFHMFNTNQYVMGEAALMYGEIMGKHFYLDLISTARIEGLEETVFKPLGGQGSNVYHPRTIVGINAATTNQEPARQFIRTMLSPAVQEVTQLCLPVNKNSLEKQFAYDESELSEDGSLYSVGFSNNKTGKAFGYSIYPATQEDVSVLEKMIGSLDTPYLSDAVIEDVVRTEGEKYLKGSQELDAAVKKIMDSVAIYAME